MTTFKPLALALALSVLLTAGCGNATAPVAASAQPGTDAAALAAGGLDAADQAELAATVETLAARFYADEGADPAWDGAASKLVGPRGGIIYRTLLGSSLMRKLGYKLAERPVSKHFSKPGVEDKVAPLSAAERRELSALLQPGDIIQCGNNGSFVHAIFYVGNDVIIHALAQAGFGKKMIGVKEETLSAYLDRADRDKVVVLRPKWTPEKFEAAVKYARAQVGKDYDTLFMTDNDDRHYCTELIFHALGKTEVARFEPHLASKAKWRLITNEDIRKSPDLAVVYRRNHD